MSGVTTLSSFVCRLARAVLSSQINNLVILKLGLFKLRGCSGFREFTFILRERLVSINERRDFRKQFIFASEAHHDFQARTFCKVSHAARQMRTVLRVESAKQVVEINPFRLFHPHAGQEYSAQFAVRKAQQLAVKNPFGKVSNVQSFAKLFWVSQRPRHIVNVAVRLQKELLVQKQVAHQRSFRIVQADKTLLEERGQRLLDFTLHSLRHRGDIFTLIQKMSNDSVEIFALGAENLHLRKHLDQSFKALEFHAPKDRKSPTERQIFTTLATTRPSFQTK